MLGGAAGGARSRPPTDLHQGVTRFPLYSLFPTQGNRSTQIHKVSESVFSSSVSSLAAPAAPPAPPPPTHSPYPPLHLELLNCSHRLLLADKETSKMEDSKMGKCIPETLCCPEQRQLLDGVMMEPLTIKMEQAKRTCNTCLTTSPKKVIHTDGGCSRTNPVTWLGVGHVGGHVGGQSVVQVKREPQHMHVSELVAVKLEQASPGHKPDPPPIPPSLNNGSIPVGIAVARQRVGDGGLLAALSQKDNQRLHDIDTQAAMTVGVANVLCDDRPAPMAWPTPAPAAPPLWQYPAQVSMESMMVGGMGGVGVGSVGSGMSSVGGFQLVREPSSGALLLLPAPPDLPHAVVWGGVPYPSTPLLLPPAPHPSHHLQLLPGDLLASTATLQHTHTHSTRLVTLAPAPPAQPHPHPVDKRKPLMQPIITPHTLIKIEPEPPQEKPQAFAPEPVQQPILTTHLYYQPDFQEQACRPQGPPAAPQTPPPEVPAHKDASNQTDHIDEDDDSPINADEDEREVACVGVAHYPEGSNIIQIQPLHQSIDGAEETTLEGLVAATVVGAVEKAINAMEREEAADNSSSRGSHDLVIDTAGSMTPLQAQQRPPVDVSGLELLSNSIEQFERTTPSNHAAGSDQAPLTIDTRPSTKINILIKTSPRSPSQDDDVVETHKIRFQFPLVETGDSDKPSLDGLGLLCALAEQRFMEEVEESPSPNMPSTSRTFIKTELLSPTEREREREISSELKKERHRHRDDASGERRRKRSTDKEERLRHKLEKMRRHKRERKDTDKSEGGELEASLRRVTACSCGMVNCSHTSSVPSAQALVNAMEKDMRERLQDLQRQCDEKRAQLDALTPPLPALVTPAPCLQLSASPALSPDSDRGSSKKRKVGRPRKVSSPDSTETIVAKKPKSKNTLVGYLLAKGKLKGNILYSKGEPSRDDGSRTSKVRPKLKAEPVVKMYSEEDENDWGLNRSASSSMESLNEVRQKNREKVDRLARKHSRDDMSEIELALRRASASSDSDKERRRARKKRKSTKSKERAEANAEQTQHEPGTQTKISKCTLTEEKIDTSPRVLTARGGLFYAGKLSAVQAPDVYAITLDGERGNKPHILSREETLRDAILEVSPSSVRELPSGTRVCAYWSQQYRCLYPGTVAVSSPDPHHDKFVAVEFDDGDSGRIAIEDIRFLEPNYPIVEYENTLFTLSKRRRNTSVTEDKKHSTASTSNDVKNEAQNDGQKEEEDRHRDRKKLKKHRKEKMRRLTSEDGPGSEYIKKKKKKHKCCEEHGKHRRHHKKHHRKHKKRHHSICKEHSSSSGDDHRQKSSSDYMDSNKSNEDSLDSNDRLSTLIAVEKSPEENMKTVIKKAVLSKKSLVKNAVLDFSNLNKITLKKEDAKDNLKDSGIGLEEPLPETAAASTSTDTSKKKAKKRTVSSTSSDGGGGVSKMAAFLPGGALWRWHGPAYRRTTRPRHRKLFYKAIQRGEEILHVGEAAVFLSTGRADRPYIGRIAALWQARGAMAVRVHWFYHPEETAGCRDLKYPGGLFESPHTDENDVQTISHKCEVLPLAQYQERLGDDPARYSTVYDNNDVYYLAGHYDPTQQALTMEPHIPLQDNS
ncbi:protein winged eye isoform X1 [Danaus plexippus]|uniref:protein winged eye isoform X1 n=1 Tax=Danaus plexippus TaxID=13037 RepID=UPI002AB1E33C|nr:protein winged eye isoform X1 [Danaus plexippus]